MDPALQKSSKKQKKQTAEYDQNNKKVTWTIKRMLGNGNTTLTAIINLAEEINSYQIRKEIGPIKMNFEVNNYTASNIFIKYLRGEAGFDPKNPPQRWIRYITTSKSYISRV